MYVYVLLRKIERPGLPALLVLSSEYWKCTKYSTPVWDSRVGNYLSRREIERENKRRVALPFIIAAATIDYSFHTHTLRSFLLPLSHKRVQCIPQQRPLYRIKRLCCCLITTTRCRLSYLYPACPATISNICS